MFFYIFFLIILLIFSSLLVLGSINPVQSILFLILVFLFSAALFVIIGAEFLGILLLVVYAGAISILFLFVVMMLNLRLLELYVDFFRYLPLGGFIGVFFIVQLCLGIFHDFGLFFSMNSFIPTFFEFWSNILFLKNNISNLGFILYNFYIDFVFLCSLILLSSMLGVIILTVGMDYRTSSENIIFKGSFNYTFNNLQFYNNNNSSLW